MQLSVKNSSKQESNSPLCFFIFVIFLTGLMMYVIAAISFHHVKNDNLDVITRAITTTSTMTAQNFEVMRKCPSCTSIEINISEDGSSVAAD